MAGGAGWDRPATATCVQAHRCTPTPEAHLCVAPSALLYQAAGHGAAHGEALEDAPNEVTEAKSHQLLVEKSAGV